jgi:WD40 repeat protein
MLRARTCCRVEGHEGVVLGVTRTQEDLLVGGGFDRTVRVWRLDDSAPYHDEELEG